ncbi:kinase-like domain-containing protein [Absidia repens]|uniref:Kinase-like domain-containing protein n=1 Tax=Absidia repens TaxID=90262 RepID=A0A1X2IT62_9FUNG|nr:kinase-like domain-containing protein [Absidia repens]
MLQLQPMSKESFLTCLFQVFGKKHKKKKQDKGSATHCTDYPPELERHYTITKNILGSGSFAIVRECTHRQTGQSYALKIIQRSAIAGKENMLHSELDILKQVRHRHIVSMHALYESQNAVYIVTDLASGGELFQRLLSQGTFTEKDASHLISQVLKGVTYLHNHDIIHRDLKPENLLFQTPDKGANLMITDFGLSKILTNHDDILITACGTPGYVAHEVLEQKGYGFSADMWSIGVITFILLVGYTPFYGADQAELFANIIKGEYTFDTEYWDDISDSAKDFIDGLLTYKPELRLTAEEALNHPWIVSFLDSDAAGHAPNLLSNVRRQLSSHPSYRSATETLDQWNNSNNKCMTMDGTNGPNTKNHHRPIRKIKATMSDLQVGKKPSRA